MIYPKPKNVSYTQMAIYIDKNAYKENCDDNLIFEYLYHLVNMLAHKANYFNRFEYYEDFSIYMATSVYMRLKNPKQFELKEDGTPKLKKIKSVLNYIKKTIYPRKVDFEQTFYSQAISPPVDEEDALIDTGYTFGDMLSDSIDELSMVEFKMCLGDVAKTARAFIKHIPYKYKSTEWDNIYLSCLLTFLNSITLKNKDIKRVQNLKSSFESKSRLVEELYQQESKDGVILYHVDESLRDYIYVLTVGMKHAIAKDLSLLLHTYVPSDSGMRALIIASINGNKDGEYYNED